MSLLLLSGGSEESGSFLPEVSGFAWIATSDEFGFRITGIRNDLVPNGLFFGDYRFGSVVSQQHPTPRAETIEYSEDMIPGMSDFSDPDDWYLEMLSSVVSGGVPAYTWTTYGTVDQTAGVQALTMRPKLEVSAWAAPTTVAQACSYSFKVMPPAGSASTSRVMIPGMESEVVGWLDADLLAGKSWLYPGIVWSGSVAGIPYDEPKGVLRPEFPATCADMYFWDNEDPDPLSRPGLCVRIANSIGSGRAIYIQRDPADDGLIVTVYFICKDCSTGINNDSDTDFVDGLQLRPMVGEDYDAIVWCRDREIAESWNWQSYGPIGSNVNLSSVAEELVVLGYASGGHLFGDYTPYYDCFHRLKAQWNLERKELAVQIYNFEATAVRPPNTAPFAYNAASILMRMFDHGITTILYEDLLEPWNKINGFGADVTSPIWDSLAITRDGYSILGYGDYSNQPYAEVPIAGEAGYRFHINPQDPAANQDHIDDLETELAGEIGVKRGGSYSDTAGGDAVTADDNETLDPEDRGLGSTTYCSAQRAFHLLQRQRMVAAGIGDPALFAEFVNPHTSVGIFDLAYSLPIYPPGGVFYGNTCLSPTIKYGRYIRISTYYSWGQGPSPYWSSFYVDNWVTYGELHNYSMARWFFAGMAMPMQRVWLDTSDPLGFIRLPDEDGYQTHYLDERPHYEFIEHLWITQKDLTRRLHTEGYRLRELTSGMTRRALDYEIDGADPQVDAAKVGSGVWYMPIEDEVIVVYANWSRSDGNPVSVTVSDTVTEALWPELGSNDQDVWLWDWTTGVVTLVARRFAGFSYTISETLAPGFVGAVVFAPANQLSQLISYPDEELGLWATRLTTGQHNYVAQGGPSQLSGMFVAMADSLLTSAGFNSGGSSLDFSDEDNSQYLVL